MIKGRRYKVQYLSHHHSVLNATFATGDVVLAFTFDDVGEYSKYKLSVNTRQNNGDLPFNLELFEVDTAGVKLGDAVKTFTADEGGIINAWIEDVQLEQPDSVGVKLFAAGDGTIVDMIWNFYRVEYHGIEVLQNPVDIAWHILMEQYWTEEGGAALIKRDGADSSFNHDSLSEVMAQTACRQILDYDQAWTDSIIQSIAEEYFLVFFQNEKGEECVKDVLHKENPADTITFAHIKGNVGKMVEPKISDIFCQPVIKYAYDHATEEYTKEIRIDGVDNEVYSSNYTSGLNEGDSVNLWTKCRSLWRAVKSVEPMPASMSEKKWIVTYDTAVWALNRHIQLMSIKRCSFDVFYTTGRKWHVGKHIKLQLPHQTNNTEVEFVIEEITKSKEKNTVSVKIMLLDEIETSFFFGE